jgi:phosphatidylserine/phosphatidylglycerophosphate/cardiolipin synthase-like enzyme
VLLGSHNWTTAGTVYNRDASLLIRDEEIARYYSEIFEFDWGRTRGTRLTDEEIAPPVRVVRAGTEAPSPKGFVRLSWREWMGEA